jgi:hypothetical protein
MTTLSRLASTSSTRNRVLPIMIGAGLVLVVATVLPPLFFAFRWSYFRTPDPDLILAYHALIFSDGLPQEFFDHTAYIYLLALSGWNDMLHALGLLPVHTISGLNRIHDVTRYTEAWTEIIEAGRAMMIASAVVVIALFTALVAWWRRDWRLGLIGGALLAGATGTMSEYYVLRTELMSSCFVWSALLLVLIADRQKTTWGRLWPLVIAGLCVVLAVATKVQASLALLTLPVLILALAQRPSEVRLRPFSISRGSAGAVIVLGAVALIAAAVMVHGAVGQGVGNGGGAVAGYKPFIFGRFGIYQPIIALYVVGAMWLYASRRGLDFLTTLSGMAAIGLGLSLGVFCFWIKYDARNIIAAVNPIEHMFVFSGAVYENIASQSNVFGGALVGRLANGFVQVLQEHLGIGSIKNTTVLEWLILAGLIAAHRDQDRRWMGQVVLLLAAGWALQCAFSLRALSYWYFTYSDPFLVLAAVIVAARWIDRVRLIGAKAVAIAALALALYFGRGYMTVHRLDNAAVPLPMLCGWIDNDFKRLPSFPPCGGWRS